MSEETEIKAKRIWCLFSVENNYDQPQFNLVVWWRQKPGFETVLKTIGGTFEREDTILVAANLLQGKVGRLWDIDYRLRQINEGKILQ